MNERESFWEKDVYYDMINNSRNQQDSSDDIIIKLFIKFLKESSGQKVLDVGCGEGSLIFELSKNLKDKIFYGIDISKTGINKAARRTINKAQFILYDGKNVPFSDNYFDLVLSSFVFEHLENPKIIFDEMTRVVKKDGLIIIACPNFGSPLFKSPCNSKNKLYLFISRLLHEFKSFKKFKSDFFWDKVSPIDLPTNVHISDYDSFCEPSLSLFEKFLKNHKDKYSIVFIDSLWNDYDCNQISTNGVFGFLKKYFGIFFKFLGMNKIFRFQYFGSFFFVVIKKL